MTDPNAFSLMVHDARQFFTELDRDNTKAWFDTNRERYKAAIKAPAELFVSLMGEELSKASGTTMQGKLFRANRDVRFSKDKRPYNTHLHMSWHDPDRPDGPSFFWGTAPDYVIAGYGLMGMQGDSLARFRALVDRDGDQIVDLIATADAALSDYGPEPLKRVPKPYDADHPHGDLLRRKSFTVVHDLAPLLNDTSADTFALSLAAFERFLPLHKVISDAI